MRYYRHGCEAKECMIVGLGGELELWHARQHLFDTRIFFRISQVSAPDQTYIQNELNMIKSMIRSLKRLQKQYFS